MSNFDLQGHRGARGLKPENTLPGFEVAFDFGVSSIETDVHLTADGVPVLSHDPALTSRLCSYLPGQDSADSEDEYAISGLTLSQLRLALADRNPDPERFPDQNASVTPLARLFAEHHEIAPYSLPTVADLFAFAVAYAGNMGAQAGKTNEQRARVGEVRFDLELKRVPYRPERIGDRFNGKDPARLEQELIGLIRATGMLGRTRVRSFDHRCIRILREIEPQLAAGVLISGTAPMAPVQLVKAADAEWYYPEFEYVDEPQVKQCHAAGIRIMPWTVNDEDDWERLAEWNVDGITTDYPDRLAEWLRRKGIAF